jgi:crotonobetainyl-CoA:carnitine CoA-transferase CaiB-like acyl-CoA transferase
VARVTPSGNRWLAFVLLEPDRYWEPLCRYLGRLDLVDDPRFRDSTLRAANADQCVRELQVTFATKTCEEWREILASFDAPWEPMQLASELPDDEQVAANDYVPLANDTRRYRLVAPPVQFDEHSVSPRRAPNAGEHNDEVLLELGFSNDQIASYRGAHVVA